MMRVGRLTGFCFAGSNGQPLDAFPRNGPP